MVWRRPQAEGQTHGGPSKVKSMWMLKIEQAAWKAFGVDYGSLRLCLGWDKAPL